MEHDDGNRNIGKGTVTNRDIYRRMFFLCVALVILIVVVVLVHHVMWQEARKDYILDYKRDVKEAAVRNIDNNVYYDYLLKLYDSGRLKQKVTCNCYEIEYAHLGNNLTVTLTYKGKPLNQYGSSILKVTPHSTFVLTITENDSIPDSSTVYLQNQGLDMDDYIDGYYFNGKVTVHENGGTRYPGAYAKFKYRVNIDPYVNKKQFERYATKYVQRMSYWEDINQKYKIF